MNKRNETKFTLTPNHETNLLIEISSQMTTVMTQQIFTTVMTHIVVDKSTENAKPHSICFLPQYQRQKKCFCSERELKKALRALTRAASYQQRKISQSDCEISNKCGKN